MSQVNDAAAKVKPAAEEAEDFNQLPLDELMSRLDATVAWFNSGDVDIDEATAKFDYGRQLVEAIKEKLAVTENKIRQIQLKLK